MLEAGIIGLLQADATISGLVGTRIYDVIVPEQPTYPCMSYQVVSASTDVATDESAVREKRIQFDGYALTYGECKQIESALNGALRRYRGTLANGVRILHVTDGVVIDNWDSDGREYRVTCDFVFRFTH